MNPWDDVHVELDAGGWTDITSTVRTSGSIVVKRGRDDEVANVQYGTCNLVLDNAGGRYSPRNPSGPYYGLIGRNTPLRVFVKPHLASGPGADVTDAFGRTVSAGWGTADAGGQVYTTWWSGGTFTTTDASVSSGVGRHSVPAATAWRGTVLHGLSVEDVDVYASSSQATADVTGGDIEPGGIILRAATDLSSYYLCRLVVSSAEVMTAQIRAITTTTGETLVASAAVTGFAWTGQNLRYRARCIGTTVQYKVWAAAGAEPAAWTVEVDDTSVYLPGGVGFRSGVGGGNTNTKPLVFAWDDISITPLAVRFHGEVSQWPPRWDLSGNNLWVNVQACGILRRLNQGNKTPRSPLERKYLELGAVAVWPLDDGAYAAVSGGSSVPGVPGFSIDVPVTFSAVDGPTGAPGRYPELAQDLAGSAQATALNAVLSASTGTSWTADFCVRAERASAAPAFVDWPFGVTITDTNGTLWIFGLWSDTGGSPGVQVTVETVAGGVYTVRLNPVVTIDIVDGQWHTVRVQCSVSGGNVTATLTVDDFWSDTDTAAMTAGNVDTVSVYNQRNDYMSSVSVGQVALFSGTSVNPTYLDFAGRPAEGVSVRLDRLGTQDGVTVALRDAATSLAPLLTVQRPAGLVDLLQDVQAADLGVLTEMRNAAALRYRTLATVYNQTPVQLGYGDGVIAPGLEPTDDDQHTWNDVTVRRYNGSSTRKQLTTGPLSTAAPPAGVGTYDRGEFTSHVDTSESLDDVGSWLLHLGTWDDGRWPTVAVELAAPDLAANPSLVWSLLGVDVGDAVGITDLPAWLPPDDVAGIVQGYEERIGPKTWGIAFTTTPAGPYTVGVYDATSSRYEATTASLSASCTSTATSLTVATTGPRFVRAADDATALPFDILVDGERITVTAVTGTSSPQTFTVTRSVNGVVKSHESGASVRLFQQTYYAM